MVIVGGGVAGLAAALALSRLDYHCTVLDSRPTATAVDRGDVLHPGVRPFLAAWGVQTELDAHRPHTFHRFRVLDGRGSPLVDADVKVLFGPDRQFTTLRHTKIVDAFRTACARAPGVTIRQAHATALRTFGGRITAVRADTGELPATLVVIASGARTKLADTYLSPARVHTYGTFFLNAVVPALPGHRDCGYYVLHPEGALVLVPLPNGLHRVGLQVENAQLDRVGVPGFLRMTTVHRFPQLANVDLTALERPRTYRLYRATRRQWWRPGVTAVGDAIHQVHPVGGQGMNLAIRDAACLAEALRPGRSAADRRRH